MNVLLRQAHPTDAGRTGDILHGFTRDNDWMPNLHSGAETIAFCGTMIARGWVTVAESDGQVAGFLARDGALIHSLYMSRGLRGQGIGARLLAQAKAQSDRLELFAFQANPGAARFYLREGFVEAARSDGRGNDENLPDIKFVWSREARET
ncbi:GNAT family N-acetyltransferase [Ruegeria sp. 2012CJ41-6]|uniref:GNAT family N-acetyltransferase n=1 Tax=Ruegeria spongiae TaxID=2942209 RepID=A0ABT0Q2M9_9RHOB|nr:GNAT family N-acetyltransferase [Ruegeria spongiae]MCL6283857.1 GNAT family N-acetyltransferase [Ruegeria spongiae]